MVRAFILGVGFAWSVGCGARSSLEQEQPANAAQGGAAQGGATATSSAGLGGHAGHAGAASLAGAAPCSALIDDMENGSGRILPCSGRVGAWYAYNDGFGVERPAVTAPGVPILPLLIPGGRGASTRAMFASYSVPEPPITMKPAVNWGAGIGVDLNFDGQHYGVYDASAYDGISFWSRGNSLILTVRISTTPTTLVDYGGTCPAEFCEPAQLSEFVSPNWQQFFVAFDELDSFEGPPATGFSRAELTNIQFLFTPKDLNSEFWLDDLSFYVER